jgi:hypothetical protein
MGAHDISNAIAFTLGEAGLNANYDGRGRLYLTSSKSGRWRQLILMIDNTQVTVLCNRLGTYTAECSIDLAAPDSLEWIVNKCKNWYEEDW